MSVRFKYIHIEACTLHRPLNAFKPKFDILYAADSTVLQRSCGGSAAQSAGYSLSEVSQSD